MRCEKPTSSALIFLVAIITFGPQPSNGLECCECFWKQSPAIDQCNCRTNPDRRTCTADSSHEGYTKEVGAVAGTQQCLIFYGKDKGGKFFIRGSNANGKIPDGQKECNFTVMETMVEGSGAGRGAVKKGCFCSADWCNCEYKLEEVEGNDTAITTTEEFLSVSSPLITPFFLLAASLFSILAVTKRETGMGFPG